VKLITAPQKSITPLRRLSEDCRGYVTCENCERFTLSDGRSVYVAWWNSKPDELIACIAPEVETDSLVKVHQTVLVAPTH